MLGRRIGLNVGIGAVLTFAVACTSGGGGGDPTTGATAAPTPPPVTSSAPSTSAAPTSSAAPSDSTVPTTGPNVRPGETVPTLPAGADRNSRPGASQFALYWFQALDWGYATTSSRLARQLYLPQCRDCSGFMSIFDSAKARGQYFSGGRSTVSSRQIVSNDSRHPGTTVVDVVLDVSALKTYNSAGKVIERDPAANDLHYRVWLSWVRNSWRVLDVKQVVVS